MMKAYAEAGSGRSGGNSARGGRGNIIQRGARAVRNGVRNVVNRVRGR